MRYLGIGLVVATLAWPAPAAAQEAALARRCDAVAASGAAALEACRLVAQAVEIAQAPIALAPAGGNPVQGTASTLGMRLGTLPRVSATGRLTAVRLTVPDLRDFERRREVGSWVPALALDAALGVYEGASPAPLVGGVGSIDLLGSIGFVPLPEGAGFDGTPFSWGLGARIGILRESFVLPGLSISGMYRHLGRVTYGDPQLGRSDAFYHFSPSDLSARAAISKRVLGFGATAGLGWDRTSSDVVFGLRDPATGDVLEPLRFDGFDDGRFTGFVNVSWTLLILHLVAEAGFEQGADRVPGPLPPGFPVPLGGHFFGGLAARLSI